LALQVTTLAEIADHTGHRLIPEALLQGNILPNLSAVSSSKHNWPRQPSPGKTAWKLWTTAIRQVFTKPGIPNQLQKPLGSWTPSAASIRTWHATFDPTTKEIYRHLPLTTSLRYSISRTTRYHHFYQNPQANNHPPTNYPLTTELQRQGFRIGTPVHPIPNLPQPQPSPQPPSLISKIRKLLPAYAPALWTNLTANPDYSTDHLSQHITQNKGQLLIVTDASLNAQKFSTFSWIIIRQ